MTVRGDVTLAKQRELTQTWGILLSALFISSYYLLFLLYTLKYACIIATK